MPTPVPSDTGPPAIARAGVTTDQHCAGGGPGQQQVNFTALVTDDRGATSIALRYRVDGQSTGQTRPMALAFRDAYQAILNAPNISSTVNTLYWYVTAQEGAGNSSNSTTQSITVFTVCIY